MLKKSEEQIKKLEENVKNKDETIKKSEENMRKTEEIITAKFGENKTQIKNLEEEIFEKKTLISQLKVYETETINYR